MDESETETLWKSKFHTPNMVVVFSNEKPDVGQMSKDRWKIFQIRDDDLLDATEKYI